MRNKKMEVKAILLTALRHKWEARDNARTAGSLIEGWTNEIMKVMEDK